MSALAREFTLDTSLNTSPPTHTRRSRIAKHIFSPFPILWLVWILPIPPFLILLVMIDLSQTPHLSLLNHVGGAGDIIGPWMMKLLYFFWLYQYMLELFLTRISGPFGPKL